METEFLDTVKNSGRFFVTEYMTALRDNLLQSRFVNYSVLEAKLQRKNFVEHNTAYCGLDFLPVSALVSDQDFSPEVDIVKLIGKPGFIKATKPPAFSPGPRSFRGKVVAAKHHIQGRRDRWLTAAGKQHVVLAERELSRLAYRGFGERDMTGHLVTVKISVECRADERVNLDGAAINEHGLKCLDAEAVQGRGSIQPDWAFLYHFLEYIVDFRLGSFH